MQGEISGIIIHYLIIVSSDQIFFLLRLSLDPYYANLLFCFKNKLLHPAILLLFVHVSLT